MKYCPECASPLMTREVKGVMRLACGICHFVHQNNPQPQVAGVIEYEGKFLLTQVSYWLGGQYALVSGHVEHDETAEQAIVRATKQTLGLEVTIRHFIGHYSCFQQNALVLAFYMEAEGILCLGEDVIGTHHVNRESLYHLTFTQMPIAQDIIRDWYHQQRWQQVA